MVYQIYCFTNPMLFITCTRHILTEFLFLTWMLFWPVTFQACFLQCKFTVQCNVSYNEF